MREGLPDDGMAGALLDGSGRDHDDVLPPGEPPDDVPPDERWFEEAWTAWATVEQAGRDSAQYANSDTESGTGAWLPSDNVPVALWPEEVLRQALTGVRGARLARVVGEATDVDGNLDCGEASGLPGSRVLDELSDDALGDLVTACGRLQSWAAGIQARVVAERAARESHALAHNSLVAQVTSELVVTETEAGEVVVRAESGAQHPTVIAALVAGRIDVRKAHTLLRSAALLTVTERAEAITRFLPQAPRRTWKWLQTRMLAFAKDRHSAGESAKAEAQRRCVQLDRAENDMGWLSAYLPATDAAAVWGVVDDMAHQLRHVAGEGRTLNQLRADSLTGIITGRLLPGDRCTDDTEPDDTGAGTGTGDEIDTGTTADDGNDGTNTRTDSGNTPLCTCGGRAPVQQSVQPVRITPTRPVVRVTVPASALLGLDDAPGHLAGFGPIPADTARLIAQDATWQRLLTDPVTGILTDYSTTTYQPGKVLRAAVQARDETCMFLTCDTPANWDDLDHIVPFDGSSPRVVDTRETGPGLVWRKRVHRHGEEVLSRGVQG
jgi:hypothetical protein